MNTRLDTLKSLAETDPYYRGYLDGMADKHGIGRDDDRTAELEETIRLLAAQLDRAHVEVFALQRPARKPKPIENAADLGAPRIG